MLVIGKLGARLHGNSLYHLLNFPASLKLFCKLKPILKGKKKRS